MFKTEYQLNGEFKPVVYQKRATAGQLKMLNQFVGYCQLFDEEISFLNFRVWFMCQDLIGHRR